MINLFTYGTLMCNDIMKAVSGVDLQSFPGILKGYTRRGVKGEHYPTILSYSHGRVEGVVYSKVPQEAWMRLDRFEGNMYERINVRIELTGGSMLHADTYVVRPAFINMLEESDWDFGEFLRKGKVYFENEYRGYNEL